MIETEPTTSPAVTRARLRAWTAQVQRFVAALPPEDRMEPPVVDLLRRHRALSRDVLNATYDGPDSPAAVQAAWRRFKRAWTEVHERYSETVAV